MRSTRVLTLVCVLALLLGACNGLPLLRHTPTPTRTRQPTWTRIPTRTPSITPTKKVLPTKTVTPIPSITPTRRPTHTPIDLSTPIQTAPVLTDTTAITATLGVSYLQLKNSLEPTGFTFPEGLPLDTALSAEATYAAVPVEMVMWGTSEALTEVEMSFTLLLDDAERTNKGTAAMLRLLDFLLPGWDESNAWLLESFQEGLTSSDERYDRATQHGGMLILFTMDRTDGSLALTVTASP